MNPERFAQYLDDVDDWFWAAALKFSRLLRWIGYILRGLVALAAIGGGVLLATIEPPLALAVLVIMVVTLLYRVVTQPVTLRPRQPS